MYRTLTCSFILLLSLANNNNRGSAQYSAEGDIVYPAGALGVVFTPAPRGGQGGTQQFFNGHTDSITALACGVHYSEAAPGGRTLVATGQLGKRPKVTRLLQLFEVCSDFQCMCNSSTAVRVVAACACFKYLEHDQWSLECANTLVVDARCLCVSVAATWW
jgi:hypothetical protein